MNNNDSHHEDITSPGSRQLELLDALESERSPAALSSSQPNLPSFIVQDFGDRRTSFPNQKDLLVNKSENDLSSVRSPSYGSHEVKFLRTHARTRSDTSHALLRMRADDTCDLGGDVEGAWSRALPASTGWRPRPRPNQSLLQVYTDR